jgi:DNA-binding MarR family transcriptional regulator
MRLAWETVKSSRERRFAATGASEFGQALMTQIRVTPGTSVMKLSRALRSSAKALEAEVSTLEANGLVERVSHPLRPEVQELHVTEAGRNSMDSAALIDEQLGSGLEAALGHEHFALLLNLLELVKLESQR